VKHRENGLRLIGLLAVAALGVMAFAASAQAVAPGFLINKKPVGTLLAKFTAEQVGEGTLLIPGLNAELKCKKFTVTGGAIETNTDAKGDFLFEECSVWSISPLVENKNCHVLDKTEKLHVTVNSLLFLPAELLGVSEPLPPALLAEKLLLTMNLTGPECILPEVNIIKGEICLAIDNNDTVEPTLLMNKEIQEKCKPRPVLESLEQVSSGGVKDKLLFGKQEAFIDATAKLKLLDIHKGLTVGVSLY
jgi:hypothetical protein